MDRAVLVPISSPRRIAYLDGWRGCAIAGVLIDHFFTTQDINLGRFGVECFFVLSGRLMADILFTKRADLGEFYLHRASRIWPALFVFIGIIIAIDHVSAPYHLPAGAIIAALTLTTNYYAVLAARFTVLDHLWSLCVEEHIYILLGLVAFTARRWPTKRPATILAIIAGLMIVNGFLQTVILHGDYYAVYWRSDVRGASILIGALTYLYRDRLQVSQQLKHYAAPAAIACALLLNLDPVPDWLKYSLGTTALALGLVLLEDGNAPNPLKTALAWPPLALLGLASYSIYLWQQPLELLAGATSWHRFLMLTTSLAAGACSYALIEQPCRKFLNARFKAKINAGT